MSSASESFGDLAFRASVSGRGLVGRPRHLATPAATSARPDADHTSTASIDSAVARTRDWLLRRQHEDGYWCAELEGDTILESEYILLLAWLGRGQSRVARRAASYILQQQMPEGGWNLYPGGKLGISGSVKAYFALKLTGHDPNADYMQRAREAILAAGGADRVNSFTRFYLALLGQIAYEHCPAVPPEMVLLPTWLPINIYRISAWSRTIFVPLSIMWAHRPVRRLPVEQGIGELFINPPESWPPLHCPGLIEPPRWLSWDNTFRQLDRLLKACERRRLRPLRRRALQVAKQWMLDRFEESDGLGAIFPPIIWSTVALKCLGYADDSAEVQSCLHELEELHIDEGDTIRLQPCKSPVWDTTITLRALAASGVGPEHPQVRRGIEWLLSKEVRTRGDWAETVRAAPGGWFFEQRNKFYPDVDDTAMGLLALHDQLGIRHYQPSAAAPVNGTPRRRQPRLQDVELVDRGTAAARRALAWMLAMQNRDGGWGAFDRDNDAAFLCHVPFADHNAMIDPSTPDLAARVLESLGRLGYRVGDAAVDRCVEYVRSQQESDGAWFGRWGVNYIYGTWQTLVGLAAVGIPPDDPAMRRGADWLLAHQQSSGAWGESPDSYEDPTLRGQGPPTASQTAWALLGLMAAGRAADAAVARGVRWLLDTQHPDGTWDETPFTGTGFPQVFYLKYHYYRIYFPLLALCEWRAK